MVPYCSCCLCLYFGSAIMLVTYFVNFRQLNDHLFGKELFILFAVSAFRKLSSIYVFSYFPFGFEGGIWDLIVSVPDHCLSFYFLKMWLLYVKVIKTTALEPSDEIFNGNIFTPFEGCYGCKCQIIKLITMWMSANYWLIKIIYQSNVSGENSTRSENYITCIYDIINMIRSTNSMC